MKTHILSAIFILTLLIMPSPGISEETELEDELQGVMKEYIQACLNGDVETYRKLRESSKLAQVEEHYKNKGTDLKPENIIPKNRDRMARFLEYPVLCLEEKGNNARLILLNKDAVTQGGRASQVELTFVIFKKEETGWKLASIGPLLFEAMEMGRDYTFPEEKVPEVLRLPEDD